jgi:hypothetical protein
LGTGEAFLGFVLPGFHKPFGNLGTGKLTSSLFSLVDQMNVVHSQENSCLCPNAQTEAKIHGVHSQENGCLCPNAQTEAEIHAGSSSDKSESKLQNQKLNQKQNQK